MTDNETLLASISQHLPGLVVVYNIVTGEYIYVNNAVTRILGYDPTIFIEGGASLVTNLIHPDDLPRIMEANAIALEKANAALFAVNTADPIVSFEYRIKHNDGSWHWLHTDASVFSRDEQGKVALVINVSMDITDRKEREAQYEHLKTSEQRLRNFIEAVQDYAIFRLDAEGKIATWNEGVEYILGYTEQEIVGHPIDILFLPEDRDKGVPQNELEHARTNGSFVQEGLRQRKDGTTFYAIATTNAVWGPDGELEGYSKVIRDVTDLKEAEETIRFQASHDTLTGLANRKALDEIFSLSKSLALRNQHKLAILFLDLDRFKNINDTLGHGIGDLILKEVSHRLLDAVRQIDVVARLGGDEFIILLNEIHSSKDAALVADKILEAFATVIRVQNESLHVTTSIGIAMFPNDGDDIYSLLKNADTALYRAKDAGRNRYQFYNPNMNLRSAEKLSLEQDLRHAIIGDELRLTYQPFINAHTGKVAGVEALVRWHHPKLGVLFPYDFISLAEETGAIIPIGKWILETVCQQGRVFADQGFPLVMTVNLSARQFAETELVETVMHALRSTEFDPRLLEIEITESVAMENISRTSSKLQELKQHGIAIAIDDFGTGYSSLSYLKRFPVHKLKIDQSFVKHSITDPQDSAIIRAIISMGHSLGLKVCAEGVERDQQQALLASMGCDFIQGYLISKPLPPEELIPWLQSQKPQ